MKKSVVLTLITIYILSICIVGYFGLKVKIYRPTIYAESVTITSVKQDETNLEVKTSKKGKENYKYVITNYQEGMIIRIKVDIAPDNTTDRGLVVEFGRDDVCELIQSESFGTGISQEILVKFKADISTRITIKSKETVSAADSIEIVFLPS